MTLIQGAGVVCPSLQDGHIFASVQIEAAGAVEEFELRAGQVAASASAGSGAAGRACVIGEGARLRQLAGKIAPAGHQNDARHRDELLARAGVEKIRAQRVDRAVDRGADARGPGAGPCGAHGAFDGDLQVLHIGRRPVVQDDKIDRMLAHLPVFMRADRLMQDGDVFGIVDLQQHDRQIAGNPQRPERGLRRRARDDLRGRGAQAGVIAHHHAAKRLEIGRIGVGDAKMAQLHLRLGPGERGGARKGRRVAVPVDQIEKRIRRVGHHGPEGHARRAASRNADPAPDREDRVQHGAGGPGQRLVDHRCRGDVAPAPDELRAVRLDLDRGGFLAFDHSDMGGPDLGVGGRAAAAGGDDDAEFGQIVRHDEHLRKGRMRLIGRRRGKHQFGIGGHVDLARAATGVGQGDASRLGIVLGRDDNFGRRRQPRHLVGEGGMVFAEDRAVTVGPGPRRLDASGPDLARGRVAQEEERAKRRPAPPRPASA